MDKKDKQKEHKQHRKANHHFHNSFEMLPRMELSITDTVADCTIRSINLSCQSYEPSELVTLMDYLFLRTAELQKRRKKSKKK